MPGETGLWDASWSVHTQVGQMGMHGLGQHEAAPEYRHSAQCSQMELVIQTGRELGTGNFRDITGRNTWDLNQLSGRPGSKFGFSFLAGKDSHL